MAVSIRARRAPAAAMLLALALPAVGAAGVAGAAGACAAEEMTTGPLVPYEVVSRGGIPAIPAPLTGKPGDPRQGERVVTDRLLGNCLSCHEVSALREEPFHGEIGPSLDGVGGRWDAATLRMIVVNPKRVFGDDTVMPAFYRTEGLNRVRPEFAGKPILTAQQVEDVVAYLAAMK
jgi:L-cysteine S-thiosulfotransferase